MKKILKISVLVAVGGAVLISALILNNYSSKSKTVTLTEDELKPKTVSVDDEHKDEVKLSLINNKKFDGYLLEIKDPTKIKVGYAKELAKKREKTSEMAKRYGAIAAINGGAWMEGGISVPAGILISDGNLISNDEGQKSPTMGITKSGQLIVGNYNVEELKKLEVNEAVSGNPPIIVNGVGVIEGDGRMGINPRTAIGQKRDGTILLLVIDGRQQTKMGATLKDVQDIMLEYGAINAINLDGGSSSTMYYDGAITNKPCGPWGERDVVSIIYVEP